MKYLLIGYGNPMRSDDGVGCHVAACFDREAAPDAHVVSVAQLDPDLGALVAQCERVVVVNASYGELPGEFRVRRIEAAKEPTEPATYAYDPATLDSWAANGAEIYVIAVGAANCAFGQGLSPEVSEAVPGVLEKIAGLFLAD